MKKLYGVTTAMITPLTYDNRVDRAALIKQTDFLIDAGVNCLYPCGTTGEMFHLTEKERMKVAETVVEQVAGRVPVYIQTGANQKDETIRLSKHAQKIGADGVGVVTPTYFSVNQREMITYYNDIAQSVSDFPLYLYNIPLLSHNDITAETAAKIAGINPNVAGIKYSFDDMFRTFEYIHVKEGFSVLTGADQLLLPCLAMGCDGAVSGISSVFPEPFVNVYNAYMKGDMALARKWQKVASRLCVLLRCGVNIAYFKTALEWRGIPGGHMRLPQLDLSRQEREDFLKELEKINKDPEIHDFIRAATK